MCGIIGGASIASIKQRLQDGLQTLEYRGYDSAGVALLDDKTEDFIKLKVTGRVANLNLAETQLEGRVGVAHTRWATHGEPSVVNAHPQFSDKFAVVHNGIIENYLELKQQLLSDGYTFVSQTDTEVIAHLISKITKERGEFNLEVLQSLSGYLVGSYAIAVLYKCDKNHLFALRQGSPLLLGVTSIGNFVASDQLPLSSLGGSYFILEDGDAIKLSSTEFEIKDKNGVQCSRREFKHDFIYQAQDKVGFTSFMQKEIFEQPQAIQATIMSSQLTNAGVATELTLDNLFAQIAHVQIVACGTSFHAGLVAKYWLEEIGIACAVETASEFRYRKRAKVGNSLLLTISQSGETADTLAALREVAKDEYLASLTICNSPGSSLIRESNFVMLTVAGPEIGVASTKAFTTQLVAIYLVLDKLKQVKGISLNLEEHTALQQLPSKVQEVLNLDKQISFLARKLSSYASILFIGRNELYPLAQEGALKLKELSYIPAVAYPAGELKHGPLALVDENMPTIVLLKDDELRDKVQSNLQEILARKGKLFIFTDIDGLQVAPGVEIVQIPKIRKFTGILLAVAMQLVSYHVATVKFKDVDKPRNLAKSVTVE